MKASVRPMVNPNSRLLETRANKVTSKFGPRTITYASGPSKGQTVTKNHNGVDVVGAGSALDNIVAHTAGTVRNAGFDSACGYYVQIITASGALMVYYHMAKDSLRVKTGDKVKQGQVLGRMGATGNVTGAHLHFGISTNGKWIDPLPYINADFEEEEMTQEQFDKMMENYLSRKAAQGVSLGLTKELAEAKQAGITDGTRPQTPCSRQEAAVMCLRALKAAIKAVKGG